MNKTVLASALALAIGSASVAEANTAGLTGVWTGTYTFSMFSPGGGPVGVPSSNSWTWDFDAGSVSIVNTATFYGSVWTAGGVTFADTGTDYSAAGGTGTANMTFSWSVNPSIPVFSSWDVTATGTTAAVSVNSAVILATSSAFPGFSPQFSGSLSSLSQVPVPAAVWLMGSGLLGLVGVARRRRRS
jgi:hypothetical protein